MLRDPQPGGLLLGEHLAQMMLIEVLGLYLADNLTASVGWLFALADKQISAAITAMHQNPGYRWKLHELAERFKQKVGSSAMESSGVLHLMQRIGACGRIARKQATNCPTAAILP